MPEEEGTWTAEDLGSWLRLERDTARVSAELRVREAEAILKDAGEKALSDDEVENRISAHLRRWHYPPKNLLQNDLDKAVIRFRNGENLEREVHSGGEENHVERLLRERDQTRRKTP